VLVSNGLAYKSSNERQGQMSCPEACSALLRRRELRFTSLQHKLRYRRHCFLSHIACRLLAGDNFVMNGFNIWDVETTTRANSITLEHHACAQIFLIDIENSYTRPEPIVVANVLTLQRIEV
jgi:hypothetical protein